MISLDHQSVERERVKDWLRYIKNGGTDFSWLNAHEEKLLAVIRRGLNTDREFKDAVRLLMLVIPHFVTTLCHTEKWSLLLLDAILEVGHLQDNARQVYLLRYLGEAYLKSGKHEAARKSFTIALERADDKQINEMVIAAYCGLARLQWFDLSHGLSKRFVKHALAIAHTIENRALRADLYDALACAYVRMAETETALGYAQTTFVHWHVLQDEAELGRAALRLATIYRHAALNFHAPACLAQAEFFMKVAREKLVGGGYAWQSTTLAYEAGVLCLQRGENDNARKWFEIALREANTLGLSPHKAVAHHSLGLAETALGDYVSADKHLRTALKTWKELENIGEQASTLQALGYLAGLEGKQSLALSLLDEGLELCQQLSDTAQRDIFEKHIQATIDEIKNGNPTSPPLETD